MCVLFAPKLENGSSERFSSGLVNFEGAPAWYPSSSLSDPQEREVLLKTILAQRRGEISDQEAQVAKQILATTDFISARRFLTAVVQWREAKPTIHATSIQKWCVEALQSIHAAASVLEDAFDGQSSLDNSVNYTTITEAVDRLEKAAEACAHTQELLHGHTDDFLDLVTAVLEAAAKMCVEQELMMELIDNPELLNRAAVHQLLEHMNSTSKYKHLL